MGARFGKYHSEHEIYFECAVNASFAIWKTNWFTAPAFASDNAVSLP